MQTTKQREGRPTGQLKTPQSREKGSIGTQLHPDMVDRLRSIEEAAYEYESQVGRLESVSRIVMVMGRGPEKPVDEFDLQDLSQMMELFSEKLNEIRQGLMGIAGQANGCALALGRLKVGTG